MTIKNKIDQLYLMAKRIDKNNMLHKEEIRLAMDDVYTQIIYDAYKGNDTEMLSFYAKEYTSQLAVENPVTYRYEITLPARVLCLPGGEVREGVVNVNYIADNDLNFVCVSERDYELIYNQDTYLVAGIIRYIVRDNKIIFLNGIDDANKTIFTVTGLRLSLVVGLDNFADTDHLVVPNGKANDFNIMVMQFLGIKQPVDLLNNNN